VIQVGLKIQFLAQGYRQWLNEIVRKNQRCAAVSTNEVVMRLVSIQFILAAGTSKVDFGDGSDLMEQFERAIDRGPVNSRALSADLAVYLFGSKMTFSIVDSREDHVALGREPVSAILQAVNQRMVVWHQFNPPTLSLFANDCSCE
jgi:hypothetical protein